MAADIRKFIGTGILIFSLSGCATLVGSGSRQPLVITTLPRGAEVKVDGVSVGRTPMEAQLLRESTKVITIEAQGYHPYEIVLTRGINPWTWGNFFFPLGFLVDLGTGAIYKLSPDQINVELRERKWDQSGLPNDGVLLFSSSEAPSGGLEQIGTLRSR